MTTPVFLAVLLAAALHAGWNAILKIRIEPLLSMALVNASAGLFGAVLVAVVGLPGPASWPFLATSGALHLAYGLCLATAYRHADMGVVYPIARGAAPLMTLAGSWLVVGDRLAPGVVVGMAILAGGIGLLALRGRNALDRRGVGWALLTAVTISLYTLSDGLGARAAGDPHAYVGAMFILDGVLCFGTVAAMRGKAGLATMRTAIGPGLAGGAMGFGAYWIAVWAMTKAPIALVAALRETSVLFATVIAIVVLREAPSRLRIAAAVLIVVGLVVIRTA